MVFQIDTSPEAAHQGIDSQIRSKLYNARRTGAIAALRMLWTLHTVTRAGDDLRTLIRCSRRFEKSRFK
ncbi:hypothetical protein ALQ50_101552 [Pseudomonas coronafaciens pv. coronafaciens]|nr:hypothetical protein ALQ50_101552 [Pseudomonas coronafaciens pv. coronafaciens]